MLTISEIVGIEREYNDQKALEVLSGSRSEEAHVFRDGKKVANIISNELVSGDVELIFGNKVSEYMKVLSLVISTVRVQQGSLIGENEAIRKTVRPLAENADIKGKKCMDFAGTTEVNEKYFCLVIHTRKNINFERVHYQIQVSSQNEEDTPLKKKMNEIGELLKMIIGLNCALVLFTNVKYFLLWKYDDDWLKHFKLSFENRKYYFEIVVAFDMAAMLEELLTIFMCLESGARKMAPLNALVGKLPSVETLGCTIVNCSNKTGTLTTIQMAVSKLVAMGSRAGTLIVFNIEGITYDPYCGKIEDRPFGRSDSNNQVDAMVVALCNYIGVNITVIGNSWKFKLQQKVGCYRELSGEQF